jgi:hypothetical protein
MSDQLQELNSLLNSDLGGVDTSRPLLKGLAELEVIEAGLRENSAKDGQGVNIVCKTLTDMTDTNGNPVRAGFKVFINCSLKETPKYSAADIKKNLAIIKEGITGTKTGSFLPIEQFIGQKFMAQLTPKLDEQFGDKTVVSRYVKRG